MTEIKKYLIILRPRKDFVDQDIQFKKFRTIFENINKFNIELIEMFHFRKGDFYMIYVTATDNAVVRFIWFLMSEIPAYSNERIELLEIRSPSSVFNFTFFDVFDDKPLKRIFKNKEKLS